MATLQKENHILTDTDLPKTMELNGAMGAGCKHSATFYRQLSCGASTLYNRYSDTNTYPYFFSVDPDEKSCYSQPGSCDAMNSIQYSYGPIPCKSDATTHANCDLVGLWLSNAATYAQYKYTPFVQTQTKESFGGFHSFEYFWFKYYNAEWYQ